MLSVKEAVIEYGKSHGYDGVYADGCGCTWDDFPACGDICLGMFGYSTNTAGCRWDCCVTADGACEGCGEFEPEAEE